jgi:hypothetical protein
MDPLFRGVERPEICVSSEGKRRLFIEDCRDRELNGDEGLLGGGEVEFGLRGEETNWEEGECRRFPLLSEGRRG